MSLDFTEIRMIALNSCSNQEERLSLWARITQDLQLEFMVSKLHERYIDAEMSNITNIPLSCIYNDSLFFKLKQIALNPDIYFTLDKGNGSNIIFDKDGISITGTCNVFDKEEFYRFNIGLTELISLQSWFHLFWINQTPNYVG